MKRLTPAVRIAGGTLLMGSEEFYPEESPLQEVAVPDLLADRHPVTNAEFRRFVKDTGHVTVAERPPEGEEFTGADPADLVPGSLVFTPTPGPVPLDNWQRWWRWQPGADWRHPEGPGSTLDGRDRHPVVHVGHEDAEAYAAWAGRRLPTESEWEWVARGGLVQARYPWGDEFTPRGRVMANTWHGEFPWRDDRHPIGPRTEAVEKYPPNGYGLFDVAGNVWEWTSSAWTSDHASAPDRRDEAVVSCCAPSPSDAETARMTMKGGSHLCAPSYCHRYRPAARQGQSRRSTTGHVGFRCVQNA